MLKVDWRILYLGPVGIVISLIASATPVLAELDPELATVGGGTAAGSGSNATGLYLQGGANFGQTVSTDPEANGNFGWLTEAGFGFQINKDSWSRLEAGATAFTGHLGFEVSDPTGGQVDLNLNYGVLATLGYGYSLGHRVFGIARFGVGAVRGTLSANPNDLTVESKEPANGLAARLGWDLILPIAQRLDVVGHIGVDHFQLDFDRLETAEGTAVTSVNQRIIANLPQLGLGLRWRL